MFLFYTRCKAQISHKSLIEVMNIPSAHRPTKAPPEQVLDAAAACFMETGYTGTSLDDVARHMGATKGRIYHYFGSKSELLHAVRKHAMKLNFAAIQTAYDSKLAPLNKFRAMALAHAMNMMHEQAYQRALFDSLHTHLTSGKGVTQDHFLVEFLAERRKFEDMFRNVLREGKSRGDFNFKTMSFALPTILAILNSSLFWYTARSNQSDNDRQAIATELVDMATRALTAPNH